MENVKIWNLSKSICELIVCAEDIGCERTAEILFFAACFLERDYQGFDIPMNREGPRFFLQNKEFQSLKELINANREFFRSEHQDKIL